MGLTALAGCGPAATQVSPEKVEKKTQARRSKKTLETMKARKSSAKGMKPYDLGIIYKAQGKTDEAISELQKASKA